MAIVVFGTTMTFAQAPNLTEQQRIDSMTIPQMIVKLSHDYNLSSDMMTTIVFRESSFNPNACHDNYQGCGVTGYHKETFKEDAEKFYKATGIKLIYESSYDQLQMMCYSFANFPEYKRHRWTTYTKYINNKTS